MKNKYLKTVVSKNKSMIFLYILMGIIIVFLETFSIYYFEEIINAFTDKNISITMIIFYAVLLILTCVISYLDTYPINYLKHKLYYDFKRLSIEKISVIDFNLYQNLGIGKSSQMIENGSTAGRDILQEFDFRMVREIIPSIILSLFFIFLIDYKITIVVFLSYIFVFIFTKLLLKKLYSIKEKININTEEYNKNFVRNIMEMLVFRTNLRYKKELNKLDNFSTTITNTKTKIRMIHESFFTCFELIVIMVKIFLLFYAFSSSLSIGALVAVISLISKAYQPIAIFNVIYVDYKLDTLTFYRYEEFLNTKNDKNLLSGDDFVLNEPTIIFDNVSFSYDNKNIINNISFKINAYESVAFVGSSGGGKSSIVKVLLGLIKNQNGKITIDNQDLSAINLNSLYPYVSYISQDSPIFDGSLKENLVFDKNINDEEILNVLNRVCLKEFFDKLPNGLNTLLGEKGVLMSGGERQRVAIARVLLNHSPIIILDEATSALDNITESKVINEVMKLNNATKIFIAHRLSSINNVDKIYVINNGEICEEGNFNTLLNNKQHFYNLYKNQENK